MEIYKVSAVSYANTLPFVYGLTRYPEAPPMELRFDHPADCAARILKGESDLGLIPVAVIPQLSKYEILPGYCLGAIGKVRTVLLVSNSPVQKIHKILLDYQSRTSVMLVQMLARDYWKISPEWVAGDVLNENMELCEGEARVIIGDRTFSAEKKYLYAYDLAEAWVNWTGLPFVFAAWVANRPIDPEFVKRFNNSLQFGLKNIAEASTLYSGNPLLQGVNLLGYLTENLSYRLDNSKMRGMKLFLEKLQTI
jgi:chorismate dehydratase